MFTYLTACLETGAKAEAVAKKAAKQKAIFMVCNISGTKKYDFCCQHRRHKGLVRTVCKKIFAKRHRLSLMNVMDGHVALAWLTRTRTFHGPSLVNFLTYPHWRDLKMSSTVGPESTFAAHSFLSESTSW
jgi:hypothetical protein